MSYRSIPSKAQAKLLAELWGSGRVRTAASDGGYIEPTMRVCIERDWLIPIEGARGKYPSGTPFDQFEVSSAGVDALEDYLRKARIGKRK